MRLFRKNFHKWGREGINRISTSELVSVWIRALSHPVCVPNSWVLIPSQELSYHPPPSWSSLGGHTWLLCLCWLLRTLYLCLRIFVYICVHGQRCVYGPSCDQRANGMCVFCCSRSTLDPRNWKPEASPSSESRPRISRWLMTPQSPWGGGGFRAAVRREVCPKHSPHRIFHRTVDYKTGWLSQVGAFFQACSPFWLLGVPNPHPPVGRWGVTENGFHKLLS